MKISLELSEGEIRALLWHVAVVDAAYGLQHPADLETYGAASKLLEAIGLTENAVLG